MLHHDAVDPSSLLVVSYPPLAVQITVKDTVLEALVVRIAQGHLGALIALQRLFGGHLLDVGTRYLDERAACEAVLGATMLEVWQEAHLHPRHGQSAREWICSISTRRAAERAAASHSTLA